MPEAQGMLLRRRSRAARGLTHTCTILRATVVPSAYEGEPGVRTYSAVATNVPCYAYTVGGSGEIPINNGTVRTIRRLKLMFAVGTDIREQDWVSTIVDETGGARSAFTLTVDAIAHMGTHLEVEVTEMRDGQT